MMSKRVERCLYCGMANAEGSKFCSNCSTPIGQAVPPQHQPPLQGYPPQQAPPAQPYQQQYQPPPPPPPVPQAKKSPMAMVVVIIVAVLIFAAIGYFVTTGFPNLGGGPADPAGTVTTQLDSGVVLDFETGTVQDRWANGQAAPTNMDDIHTTDRGNFEAVRIVDIGEVSGVGAVISNPTSGWVTNCAIIDGHGYVVQSQTGTYYRVYVTSKASISKCTIKWCPMP
jgi:hypothetical protein